MAASGKIRIRRESIRRHPEAVEPILSLGDILCKSLRAAISWPQPSQPKTQGCDHSSRGQVFDDLARDHARHRRNEYVYTARDSHDRHDQGEITHTANLLQAQFAVQKKPQVFAQIHTSHTKETIMTPDEKIDQLLLSTQQLEQRLAALEKARRRRRLLWIFIAIALPAGLWAGTSLHIFKDGDTLTASQLNENFQALAANANGIGAGSHIEIWARR
jgi:hypothetical protein